MNKPYTTEIVKLMAEHSDEAAAYASAMKWDFWRRQKVEDINIRDLTEDSGFCKRWLFEITCLGDCLLFKRQQSKPCTCSNTIWYKVIKALEAKDQQAFTIAANDLYFLIRSIIDDMYKPKPEPKKEEVLYHAGQRFKGGFGKYILANVGEDLVLLVDTDGHRYCGDSVKVSNPCAITEKEMKKLKHGLVMTLIEDKKK